MNWLKRFLSLLAVVATAASARPSDELMVPGRSTVIRLTKDPVQRAADFDRIRRILTAMKSQANVQDSTNKDGGASTNSFGDCGGFWDNSYDCSGGNLYIEDSFWASGYNILARVRVTGQSQCTIAIESGIGNGIAGCGDVYVWINDVFPPNIDKRTIATNTGDILAPVVEVVKELATVISPLLPKCAVTPPANAIKNPNQDAQIDYGIAKDSIVNTYMGNLSSIRAGVRVDVQYPSGWVARFLITWIAETQHGVLPGNISMNRMSDPPASETPCKP